jgi:hypothetical protein
MRHYERPHKRETEALLLCFIALNPRKHVDVSLRT